MTKDAVPREDVRLTLNFASLAGPLPLVEPREDRTIEARLGSIWFDEDGAPGDTITIDDAAVMVRVAKPR